MIYTAPHWILLPNIHTKVFLGRECCFKDRGHFLSTTLNSFLFALIFCCSFKCLVYDHRDCRDLSSNSFAAAFLVPLVNLWTGQELLHQLLKSRIATWKDAAHRRDEQKERHHLFLKALSSACLSLTDTDLGSSWVIILWGSWDQVKQFRTNCVCFILCIKLWTFGAWQYWSPRRCTPWGICIYLYLLLSAELSLMRAERMEMGEENLPLVHFTWPSWVFQV